MPLVALWVLIWAVLDVSYWLSLLLAVPAAGFLVRLFMIQHDCSHGAFFRHRLFVTDGTRQLLIDQFAKTLSQPFQRD